MAKIAVVKVDYIDNFKVISAISFPPQIADMPALWLCFFYFYLAVRRPTLAHSREDSLTNPRLITAFVQFRLESHWEPYNVVESLSPAKRLLGFERNPPILIQTP